MRIKRRVWASELLLHECVCVSCAQLVCRAWVWLVLRLCRGLLRVVALVNGLLELFAVSGLAGQQVLIDLVVVTKLAV